MTLKTLWAALPRGARIYISALGALSVAALATVVTVAASGAQLLAASPSPTPSPGPGQAYCNAFTGHLANNLGKSQSQVQKAISDAITQTLNDAVKNGDLTQKQADAVKSRMGTNSSQVCAALPGRIGLGPDLGRGFDRGRFAAGVGLNENAKALGISSSELMQDLRSGQTVQSIAAQKGMDENAFRSKLVSVTRSDLDAQVKAGNLTQKQEDAVLQRLQNDPLPLWNQTLPRPGRHPGGEGPGPSPGAATSSARI